VVQKGDNLSVLAKRHGVPEIKLSEWNGLPPKAPLKVGQEILLLGV
jgi:membrane-bound lytic murein transglycosylase D